MGEETKSIKWTHDELRATVEAYISMLKMQESKTPFSKSQINDSLRLELLKERSKASVEYRMQNISYVMVSLGLKTVKGYLPKSNVGINVINEIIKDIEDFGFFKSCSEYEYHDEEERDDAPIVGKLDKPKGNPTPIKKSQSSDVYERCPAVRAFVLQRASGKCENCGKTPFLYPNEQPYLEVHHLLPLAKGGPDTAENAVAVCPNCHKEMHHGKDAKAITDLLIEKLNHAN
jgi:5-methylcytosine-specific restriction protein A